MLRSPSVRPAPHQNDALVAQYKAQNPSCELFDLFWREQRALLERIWPGRLFRFAVDYAAIETHHIWHPGNRPDLLSNLIRLSKPIHAWCQEQDPNLGRVICSWWKLQKGEADLKEIKTASGFYLDGWLQLDKVVGRSREVDGWWDDKRLEAIDLVQELRVSATPLSGTQPVDTTNPTAQSTRATRRGAVMIDNNGNGNENGNGNGNGLHYDRVTKLSASDDLLALALAQGLSVRDAAKSAGISERTAHRRQHRPEFRRRVHQLRDANFQRVANQMSTAAQDAVTTLNQLLLSHSETMRLQAARCLLQSLRLRDALEVGDRTSEWSCQP